MHGIDSVHAPRPLRLEAWARLAADLDPAKLGAITKEIGLADALGAAADVFAGKMRGPLVVDVRQ